MKKSGKVLIGVGFFLTGIPLLFAVLNALYSSNLMTFGFLRGIRYLVSNPMPSNVFWKWLTGVVYYSNRVFVPSYLWNFLLFFIPNVFIISGFVILINQNLKIDIKKCYNIIVLIGLAVNILVIFRFFDQYSLAYRNVFISPLLLRLSSKYGILMSFVYFIFYLLFYLIPVLPAFIITFGYKKFFKAAL